MSYVEPKKQEEFLRCFRVDDDNALLQGMLLMLRGMRETAAENAEVIEQKADLTVKFTAQMAGFREAEERLLDLVEQARSSAKVQKKQG